MSRKRRRSPANPPPLFSLEDALYPTLDLHGLTAEEATREARLWLLDRRAEGETTVRLVTGKGLHSVGPPILPSAIGGLLQSLKGVTIRQFEREPGGGAYRVVLTRGSSSPRTSPAPAGRYDPEILRQAREALEELGISPTPALLEAEVRRIYRKAE